MLFKIPEKIDFVLKKLEENGFEAYIVGGCVRDLLCHRPPHDFDITTSAKPHEVRRIFEKTVNTGIKHGTVTVIVGGEPVEVTTYRTESGYSDSRRPDEVRFVSDAEKDLARRDFTVNAICYNPRHGILDLFGGREDIKSMTLRAVGEPERRFNEDALRIIRLFRFSSVLGFSIEEQTLNAAIDCAGLLRLISRERISSELTKAICGMKVGVLLPLLECGGLEFLGIKSNERIGVISKLPPKAELRLYAFFSMCCSDINAAADELKLSNSVKRYMAAMQVLKPFGVPCTRCEIKRALCATDFEMFCDRMEYLKTVHSKPTEDAVKLAYDIMKCDEPYKISHLNISGNEISERGISGKDVGKELERLLNAVIEDPTLNTYEKLSEIIGN